MTQATANGIHIEYDTFGDVSDRPLLLIIGLGGQMIAWDDDLVRTLQNVVTMSSDSTTGMLISPPSSTKPECRT